MKSTSFFAFLGKEKRKLIKTISKSLSWFFLGVAFGLFLIISFIYILFIHKYETLVYPGVTVAGVNVGGKSQQEIQNYFDKKNASLENTHITFTDGTIMEATSAKQLNIGYNSKLLAEQAASIGRSQDLISNVSTIIQAYLGAIDLPPSYSYSNSKLASLIDPIRQADTIQPVEGLFTFQNGRVTAFQQSSDGKEIDYDALQAKITSELPTILNTQSDKPVVIMVPFKTLKPKVTTSQANNLGIKELIASGTSLFQHSADTRIFNVELAASRLNGILVAPGETFSFDKALGDVSSFTGYKQAYVIQNGKTVLGDGGGVCQVSTTLFRAILNAGLPIVERHAHAYRVGYYEEDSPPGFDATVYVPTVDLKFTNDTDNYILIQSVVDPSQLRLTFNLYGTKDGRAVSITTPTVTNIIPAPAPLYQDDPSLPSGTLQQTDFAANGATVSFSRTVTKGGKTVVADTYTSVYQPWQAVFLRGTGQ